MRDPDTPDAFFLSVYQHHMYANQMEELYRCAEEFPERVARLRPHLLKMLVYTCRYRSGATEGLGDTFHQAVARLGLQWTDAPNVLYGECMNAYIGGRVRVFCDIVDAFGYSPLTPEQLACYDPTDLAAIEMHMDGRAFNYASPEMRQRRRQCIEYLLPRPKNANG